MKIFEQYSLKDHNTFLIDVKAKYFVELESESEISEFFALPQFANEKKFLIGGGANILFTKDFDGVIYKVNFGGIEIVSESDSEVIIQAKAGVNWDNLVKWSVDRNYFGLENLAGIPGSVGAAPVQNIGAYGEEQKNCFLSLKYYNIEKNDFAELNYDECRFGYRDSIFKGELKNKAIVVSVNYKLSKSKNVNLSYSGLAKKLAELGTVAPTPKDIYSAITLVRNEKLPELGKIGSAGSFFKNPIISRELCEKIADEYNDLPQYTAPNGVKISAAFLIDKCGWKGFREADFGVWKYQPLVLVNFGSASGSEIKALAERVIADVKIRFGVELEPEAIII